MDTYQGELVTLRAQNGKVAQISIAGDHKVYGAMMMVNTLSATMRVVGGDEAIRELEPDAGLMALVKDAGLLEAPPPAGEVLRFGRPYAQVACKSPRANSDAYVCDLTPP